MAGLLAVFALTGMWAVWAASSHVTVYETSESARLEAAGAAYPLQSGATGRVVSLRLTLGREVRAGDVLVEIENDDVRLNAEMERTRAAALMPQLDALHQQIQMETVGQDDERRVLALSQDGARAQWKQAEAEAVAAAKQAERARLLRDEKLGSAADAERASAEAESKRAAAENLRAAVDRLGPELQVRERDRQVKLKEMVGAAEKLEAQLSESKEAMKRLDYDRERRLVRAPISGRIGECAVLGAGSRVAEGQQLAIILGGGALQVVAEFPPSSALGRILPGQRATVRLQGFPWMQYGTVAAQVTRVASEIRDGHVRVEMAVDAGSNSRTELRHGLPGTVEVEVERVTPFAMLLRSVGAAAGTH
jgi:membrane fusion protein (multidrug efflux system)